MARFRKIKRWSTSTVILLNKDDLTDLGWEEGNEVDISGCSLKRNVE